MYNNSLFIKDFPREVEGTLGVSHWCPRGPMLNIFEKRKKGIAGLSSS